MADSATLTTPTKTCPAWCTDHETDGLGDIHATTPIDLPGGGVAWLAHTVGFEPVIVLDGQAVSASLNLDDAAELAAIISGLAGKAGIK